MHQKTLYIKLITLIIILKENDFAFPSGRISRYWTLVMCETVRTLWKTYPDSSETIWCLSNPKKTGWEQCLMCVHGRIASPWPVLPCCGVALTGAGAGAGLQLPACRADGSARCREQEGAWRRSVAARVPATLTQLQWEADVLGTLRWVLYFQWPRLTRF